MKLKPFPGNLRASELLEDRKRGLNKVLVTSASKAYGYWGRGWSVQTAIKNAKYLCSREVVFVCLATDQTYIGDIHGGIHGKHGTIYRGTVTADKDVRITHVVEV